MSHVLRGRRRANGYQGFNRWQPRGRTQHRGAAEAMPYQDLRCAVVLFQRRCSPHQVIDVGGKIGVGKISVAIAKSGKVESQYRDPARGQRTADA